MTPFGKCGACRKKRWFVRFRKYRTKALGDIQSKGERCGACHKKMLGFVAQMDSLEPDAPSAEA